MNRGGKLAPEVQRALFVKNLRLVSYCFLYPMPSNLILPLYSFRPLDCHVTVRTVRRDSDIASFPSFELMDLACADGMTDGMI